MKLTFNGQLVTEITADQLGMTVDITDVMNQAWSAGARRGRGPRVRRPWRHWRRRTFEAYTAMPSGDTTVVDGILQDIRNNVYRAPQDARLLSF